MGEITQTYKLSTDDKNKHRLYCKECCGITLHSIVSSYDESMSEDCGGGNSVDWHCKNQTIQCLGCQKSIFQNSIYFFGRY